MTVTSCFMNACCPGQCCLDLPRIGQKNLMCLLQPLAVQESSSPHLTEHSRTVLAHLTARSLDRWVRLAAREGQVAGEEPAAEVVAVAVVANSRPAPARG